MKWTVHSDCIGDIQLKKKKRLLTDFQELQVQYTILVFTCIIQSNLQLYLKYHNRRRTQGRTQYLFLQAYCDHFKCLCQHSLNDACWEFCLKE